MTQSHNYRHFAAIVANRVLIWWYLSGRNSTAQSYLGPNSSAWNCIRTGRLAQIQPSRRGKINESAFHAQSLTSSIRCNKNAEGASVTSSAREKVIAARGIGKSEFITKSRRFYLASSSPLRPGFILLLCILFTRTESPLPLSDREGALEKVEGNEGSPRCARQALRRSSYTRFPPTRSSCLRIEFRRTCHVEGTFTFDVFISVSHGMKRKKEPSISESGHRGSRDIELLCNGSIAVLRLRS